MLDKKENGTIRFAGNQNPIATFNTMRIAIGMQPHPKIDASRISLTSNKEVK